MDMYVDTDSWYKIDFLFWVVVKKVWGTSDQGGGVGKCPLPPCTTTSKLQWKYRTNITQNCPKLSWMKAWQLPN